MGEVPEQKSETAKREEEVLAFWREDKTFEKSLEKDAPQGEFVFYDGPPFATGLPHHGSLLSSIIKDVIPRYKTMRGFRVRRRWGWDTHGLPIESLVEKELGLKTKKDILDIGIATFNEKARSMVLQFVDDWEKYVERIGRWVDFKNSYKTMDNTYIESVWWALKQLHDKNLLYEGRKVLMYCPHCETPLAKAEIAMDNTYKDVTEEAVTVKFKVKLGQKIRGVDVGSNTYLLAWTTTPWTLPGNVALAVGPEIEYEVMKHEGERFVYASSLRKQLGFEGDPEQGGLLLGKSLIGLEYEPLFDISEMRNDKSHRVYAADFVSTGEGTGIVHTAVVYGEDDYQLGLRENLPVVSMLNPNGTYNDVVPEFLRGLYIKAAEKEIKRDLENRGLLFEKKNHTHSYPHCYRCGTPLIYNAVSSWFINIQKVKARMLEENEQVNWVPDHLKHGRFGNIVESAPDWTISRNRFWASPLPVWRERGGSRAIVIGSVEELKQRVKKSGNTYFTMRHGEAETNTQNILNCDPHARFSLTEKGRLDVANSAEHLRAGGIDLIVVSPLLRTRETAEIVRATLELPESAVVVDDRLREVNFGSLNGIAVDTWRAQFPENVERFSHAPEGGENNMQIKERVADTVSSLERTYSGKRILIISHGTPLWLLRAAVEGLTPEQAIAIYTTDAYPGHAVVQELPYVPLPRNARYELDLHRPYIDGIILTDNEGREYERIPEVVDCWVESGAMPFAEYHYPFEHKDAFEKRLPGDFIAEYIAQTRTWFYYMHALGVLLFDRLAFRNVVSTGTILAADGEKISKSKRNYTDPLELINRYGSDAMRFYLMSSPVMQAEDIRFRDEDVRDAHNRLIGTFWNSYKFYELYKDEYDGVTKAEQSPHVLDRWILARLKGVVESVTRDFDAYNMALVCRTLREFVEEYSTWYVRRSRERVKLGSAARQVSGDAPVISRRTKDDQYTLATQREVLTTIACLAAPITPFVAESVYRGVHGNETSVHLSEWPSVSHSFFASFFDDSESVLASMHTTRVLVSRALEARDSAKIRVRQPLGRLEIGADLSEDFRAIIAEEVNVKSVERAADLAEDAVRLDTTITPELRREGYVREVIRAVQSARKTDGLKPGDIASATITVQGEDLKAMGQTAEEEIKATASLSQIEWRVGEDLGEVHVSLSAR